MADLSSRLEMTKLSRLLGIDESAIAFLHDLDKVQLRDLRITISDALFARNEARFKRVAALSKSLPAPLSAKIAQKAVGPMLCANIANVLDPPSAVKLARHFNADFLVEMSVFLDPARVAPIVEGLSPELVTYVGRSLLQQDEFVTLGRFVAVVNPGLAMNVIAGASGGQLLQVALFTEDAQALDVLMTRLDDDTLFSVIEAAAISGQYDDALALFVALKPASRNRLMVCAARLDAKGRNGLIQAVVRNAFWAAILPELANMPAKALAALVNVPASLAPGVLELATRQAQVLGATSVLEPLVLALDDKHLAAVQTALPSFPVDLVTDVTQSLLRQKQYAILGRFVAAAGPDLALAVVGAADATDLYQVALATTDRRGIDTLLERLDASTVFGVVEAAVESGEFGVALTFFADLAPAGQSRIVDVVAALDAGQRDRIAAALERTQFWASIPGQIGTVPVETLGRLGNVLSALNPDTLLKAIDQVQALGLPPAMTPFVSAFTAQLRAAGSPAPQ